MTTVLAIIAVVVSVAALAVSWWLGLRSARAAERSSADARRVAQAEMNRDHEMYRPTPAGVSFEKVRDDHADQENLVFVFTPGRSYRLAGDAMFDAGAGREESVPLDVGSGLAKAGVPVRWHIGELTGGGGPPLPKALRLKFWPPAEGDPGEPWTCQCGQPLHPSVVQHWECRIALPDKIDDDLTKSFG